jgi:putative glycerol-1-phosphate prenyltransferase
LIAHQVATARKIEELQINCASTAYLLLDGGTRTSAMQATGTVPIPFHSTRLIFDTCLAAKQMGFQQIYLEAGSGAMHPVPANIIKQVKQETKLTLWVGGGIRTVQQREQTWQAGADWVVMGNVFEERD